jgi:hypothetical protein
MALREARAGRALRGARVGRALREARVGRCGCEGVGVKVWVCNILQRKCDLHLGFFKLLL